MASAAIPQAELPQQANNTDTGAHGLAWPLGALALLLALQLTLVFTRAINWDEFYFYHEVARFADGHLDRPLQTIHVRLFAFLPEIFGNPVDAIRAARLAMFACELATLASIVLIARRLADTRTAIFAALLYISAGYVLQHGMSFRVDPIVTAALMSALAVLATSRLRPAHIVAFGVLAGFAGMVTIKAVLFAPAFAGIAWWRWSESDFARARLASLAACVIAALVGFAILYAWHSQALPAASDAVGQSGALMQSAGGWAFFLGVPPYIHMAIKSMLIAPLLYGCIMAAPFMIRRANLPMAQMLALAGLWLPITTIFFYTNSAAYFYAFILAPVAIATVLPLQWALARYGSRMLALVLMILAAGLWLTEDRSTITRQHRLVENVQQVFPRPVTYFDQSFMLAGWPKANGFMTPWGMQTYRDAGEASYRAAMEREIVPLLLVNSEELETMLVEGEEGLLLPADDAAIRRNYLSFNGPIWLAGKGFAGNAVTREEFLVPGSYRIAGGAIAVDGVEHAEDDIVAVDRGLHDIAVLGADEVRMIWAEAPAAPEIPLEEGPLYVGF